MTTGRRTAARHLERLLAAFTTPDDGVCRTRQDVGAIRRLLARIERSHQTEALVLDLAPPVCAAASPPVAVNVATGGSLPKSLQWMQLWVWPMVGVITLATVIVGLL